MLGGLQQEWVVWVRIGLADKEDQATAGVAHLGCAGESKCTMDTLGTGRWMAAMQVVLWWVGTCSVRRLLAQ